MSGGEDARRGGRAPSVVLLDAEHVAELGEHPRPSHIAATRVGQQSNWQALEKVARTIARKRGSRSVPRLARQTQEDRDRAVILLLGLAMGLEKASDRLSEDAAKLERALGVHQGRRSRQGLPAWLTGPASDGFADFVLIASLPALIRAVEAAPDPSLPTSGETLTIEESMTLRARTENAGHVADEYEWSWGSG